MSEMKRTRRLLALMLILDLLLTALPPLALGEEEIILTAPPAEAAEAPFLPEYEAEDIEIVPAPDMEEDLFEEEPEVVPAPEPEEAMEAEEPSPFVVQDGVLTAYTGEEADVVLPEGVTVIAAYTFADNAALVSVACPDTLQAIEDYAFAGCTALQQVTYPETAVVGELAFEGSALAVPKIAAAEEVPTVEAPDPENLHSHAPIIRTQPVDATVPVGGSVTLSIIAAGTGLACQWQYLAPNVTTWTNCTSLTELDLSDCSALTDFYCYKNSLSTLDLSGCPALKCLNCSENNLTTLDLSGCSALEYLYCPNNSLTSLDLTACPNCQYCCDGDVEVLS